MNILVTGANGQLGSELRLLAVNSIHRFIFTDVIDLPGRETVFLDICDPDAVKTVCDSESVDLIINCAAYTNVNAAESDPDAAASLNAKAPSLLADIAAARRMTLIHISTDYVFDGSANVPYKESVTPSPCSVYGRTKLAGEEAVRRSGCRSIIIRTAWLYSRFGKNFVKTIGERCVASDKISVVVDQVGSPTCATDLAAAIMYIIDSGQLDKCGTYHFSNEGAISWFDFARAIADLRSSDCKIVPCSSSDYPSPVHRPNYSVLDKSKFKDTFGFEIPYWRTSLSKCIAEIWK